MFLNVSKKEAIWWLTKEIISEIFKVSLISYLIFYLIESFKAGFIADYFNLNILLIITILSGVFTVLFKKEEESKKEVQKIRKRDYIFIIILGVVATGLIYYKIKEIGWLSYVISPISGIIIILISILLLNEQQENDQGSED